jgi:hypothetical protein
MTAHARRYLVEGIVNATFTSPGLLWGNPIFGSLDQTMAMLHAVLLPRASFLE